MTPRTRALLEAPIAPTIAKLAAPTIVVSLVDTAVALAETAFLGRLGTDVLAGYTLVFPIVMLMRMMSTGGMGGGIAAATARAVGAGDAAQARAVLWHGLGIAVALGLFFTILVSLFGRQIYGALGGRGEALEQAVAYSNVLFAGMVLIWIVNTFASVLRGSGDARTPGRVMVCASLLQLGLGYVLIFPAGMGIVGAAWATLAAQAAGAVVLGWYLLSGRGGFRAEGKLRFSKPALRDILRVGLIASLMTILANLTTILVTAIVARFGTAAIAGYGIGARLEFLQIPIAFGIGAALTTLVGVAVGAGDWERARRAAWTGGAMAMAVSGFVGITLALIPAPFIAVFTTDPAVALTATHYFQYAAPAFTFFGLGMALYFASQGAGRMKWPFIAGLFRLGFATIGGYTAVLHFGLGLEAVFLLVGIGLFAYGGIIAASIALGSWRPRI